MDMGFGKYKGKTVAWVLFEHPEYFTWMRSKNMDNYKEYLFSQKLIKSFNDMPFVNVKCNGSCKGKNPVTRISLYNNIYNGSYWFCDSCDPYELGAISGKLSSVRNFDHAVNIQNGRQLIKDIASAKGMPKRKTKEALKIFFGY